MTEASPLPSPEPGPLDGVPDELTTAPVERDAEAAPAAADSAAPDSAAADSAAPDSAAPDSAAADSAAPDSAAPPSSGPGPFAGVPDELAAALNERGFAGLTAVQQAVVQHVSQSGDHSVNLRISSQTGSGKTVALGIAVASTLLGPRDAQSGTPTASEPTVLVITPTRELAHQVHRELEWLFARCPGISVTSVTGGTDVRREQQQIRRRPPRILVGTPGRLLDHLRSGTLVASGLREVVLDEADSMLDLGFKDELDAIVALLPARRRSHLVSATFPPAVNRLAHAFQGEARHVEGTALGRANADIEHVAYLVRPRNRYDGLVNLLLSAHGERCLIFVRTRAETAELAETLAGDGFGALPFSGELPQAQRSRTLSAFRNGTINILVATDVAARGIDVPDIATVIHTDIPGDSDVYTHRSGRTGRAGKSGKSLILVPSSGQGRIERMLRTARVTASFQPIPSAKKIRQAVTKSTRRELYERLDDVELSESELAYAQGLMEKLPADRVIALLLRMAETRLPRPPADVESPAPRSERGGAPQAAPRGAPPRAAARGRGGEGYVRFRLSWGSRHGATPARCMSHVCRRGGIGREQVGAIQVDENATIIEITSDAAAEFERRCKRPDPRDPLVRVSRDRDQRSEARSPSPRRGPGPPPRGPARPASVKGAGPRVKRAARRRHTASRPTEA